MNTKQKKQEEITQGIRYLGSKKKIIPYILDTTKKITDIKTVCDLFAGTTRVSQAFKKAGYNVITNDITTYSKVFANCYIGNNKFNKEDLQPYIDILNATPECSGWLTENYAGGTKSKNGKIYPIKFWQMKNTKKADAIRSKIDEIAPSGQQPLRDILLTSLILALDSVDNTLGLQQAFLKNEWSIRSFNNLELKVPNIIVGNGKYHIYQKDANALINDWYFAPRHYSIPIDLVYIDPPYTANVPYYSYYHIWETIAKGDRPEVFGVANKRIDIRETRNKSAYCNKKRAKNAFQDLINKIDAKYILISYSNEGIVSKKEIVDFLEIRGKVTIKEIDYKRNIMSDLGHFDNTGVRVNEKSHDKNIEFLFLCEVKKC